MENKERIRSNIIPKGLNLSTPDGAVEDGALSVCNNLRFANGAWRNVNEFLKKNLPSGILSNRIAYIHPANGKAVYIL